jgi:hypothetical protein
MHIARASAKSKTNQNFGFFEISACVSCKPACAAWGARVCTIRYHYVRAVRSVFVVVVLLLLLRLQIICSPLLTTTTTMARSSSLSHGAIAPSLGDSSHHSHHHHRSHHNNNNNTSSFLDHGSSNSNNMMSPEDVKSPADLNVFVDDLLQQMVRTGI